MARISDKDRKPFSEAGNTVLDNFTAEEQVCIGELSTQLNSILDAAKKRQQEKLAKAAP